MTTFSSPDPVVGTPSMVRNARLPRWLLPAGWPCIDAAPALADLRLEGGRLVAVTPAQADAAAPGWDVQGAPTLPGLVDAHTHLDKAFILPRLGNVAPGLLAAIEAMAADRARWTAQDLYARATKGLQWAWESGSTHLRTHVDWHDTSVTPLAWQVVRELTQEWAGRITIEQVNLTRLPMYADRGHAFEIARNVARAGRSAVLGGFVHSTHWSEPALRNLLLAAQAHGLDVDLHVDEELEPAATGLASTARILREIGFEGRVACGHVCSLAVQEESTALATLDAVAAAPITLICLPATNLLLQDASTGRTPRQRGITLVKEARERGIPLLMASDNVQDPFCPSGSFDPVDALAIGAMAAQLPQAFDEWSQAVCRSDWLGRAPAGRPQWLGGSADLVIFSDAEASAWPSRSAGRVILRGGRLVRGAPPANWLEPASRTELSVY